MKLEYDYLNFGNVGVATPVGLVQVAPAIYAFTAPGVTNVNANVQQVKLGFNYKLGADGSAGWAPLKSSPMDSGWQVEGGARYWYSSGRWQKDLGGGTTSATADNLNSRLTYTSTGNSGEFFARVDFPWGVFAKGFIGGGTLNGL